MVCLYTIIVVQEQLELKAIFQSKGNYLLIHKKNELYQNQYILIYQWGEGGLE